MKDLMDIDLSKEVRDKDGLSWADKKDKIILACFGVGKLVPAAPGHEQPVQGSNQP